jgi:hypothetical protein
MAKRYGGPVLRFVGWVLCITLVVGCAPALVRMSPDDARAEYGRLAVFALETPPTVVFNRPVTSPGEGAKTGALVGAVAPILAGWEVGAAYGAALGILVSPITAIGGAVYGAIAAQSEKEIARGAQVLDAVVAEFKAAQAVRDALMVRLRREPYLDLAADEGTAPGTDTIVEVQVTDIGLIGQGINPNLTLSVGAVVRVRRAGVETLAEQLLVRGDSRTFLTWAARDGNELRTALERQMGTVAERMLDAVLTRRERVAPSQ